MHLSALLLSALAALATASDAPPAPFLLPPCTRALAVRADVPPACACAVTVVPSVADADAGRPPSQPLHAVTGVPVAGLAPGHWTLAVACAAPCAVVDGGAAQFPLTLAPCAPDAVGAGMAVLPHVVTVVAEGGKGGGWGWVRGAAAVVAVGVAAAQAALSLM